MPISAGRLAPEAVDLARAVCSDERSAGAREWLVTNGNGAYASGTIDGSLTRRYHGLLVAAMQPPVGRTVLVAKFDERATYRGAEFPLSVNRWRGAEVDGSGAFAIERFFLDGSTPVWWYAFGDALLEKRVTMERGRNATLVRYALLRGCSPLTLEIKALVNDRDFHSVTPGAERRFAIESAGDGVRVEPAGGDTSIWLCADRGTHALGGAWYRNFDLPRERERGTEDVDAHLLAATFSFELAPGDVAIVRASTVAEPSGAFESGFERTREHDGDLLRAWSAHCGARATDAPPAIRQLVLAADQFIVSRAIEGLALGRSIVAGYHWFGDWGRDAMIALPGLTLATGRFDVARSILTTFAHFVEAGLVPNYFPDRGNERQYNTVDASLWFIEAVRAYVEATNDASVLDALYPAAQAIVAGYRAGTRYGIHVDPSDGLVSAGMPGVQLTWMDAKVGDHVITPRYGKPVEINALWYNALISMSHLAARAGHDGTEFAADAERVRASFARFEGGRDGGLFDLLDGPDGNDRALRPNQIFAVSLPHSPLDANAQRNVLDCVERNLVTSYGLRTLARDESGYRPRYEGSIAERDGAYHQGTVWPWLLGPFVTAHARVRRDHRAALAFLDPLLAQMSDYGVGSIAEIADADPPFKQRGCIAQAWSVAEVLRAWDALSR